MMFNIFNRSKNQNDVFKKEEELKKEREKFNKILKEKYDEVLKHFEEEKQKYEERKNNLKNYIPDVEVKKCVSGYFVLVHGEPIPAKFIERVKQGEPNISSFHTLPHINIIENHGPIFLWGTEVEYPSLKHGRVEPGKLPWYFVLVCYNNVEIVLNSGEKHIFECYDFETDILLGAIRHAWLNLENPY